MTGYPRALLPVLLLLLLYLGPASGADYSPEAGLGHDWSWLDHWGTVLRARRKFSRQSADRRSSLSLLRNATHRHGMPTTLELDFESEDPPEVTPTQWRRQRDEAIARAVGPFITPVASELISPECLASSWSYLVNMFRERWALQMFDATGKLPDGILLGNVNPYGNWDECLNTTGYYRTPHGHDKGSNVTAFSGKYCLAVMVKDDGKTQQSPLNLRARSQGVGLTPILPFLKTNDANIGVCIPSTCSSKELQAGLNAAISGVTAVVHDNLCYTQDEQTTFTAGDIVMIVILSIVGLFMIVGTVIDVVAVQAAKKSESWWALANARQVLPVTLRRVFLAFSVYTNGRKLLDTSTTKDTLGCLHGIRFISNTWVILGHTYYILVPFAHQNPFKLLSFFGNFGFLTITDATVSVDTFFLLSGLLVSYSVMRSLERTKGKLNILMFYVHRYIRLTPVMMMVLAFISTLYVHLGSGPNWGAVSDNNPSVCRQKWWMNMLYVNNIDDLSEQCLGQTWYLANDMQMFLFSPLILLPLYHWPVFGQLWLIFLICFFTGINAMVTVTQNLGPAGSVPGGGDGDLRYEKPWTRFGPYLVGLYMGWVMNKIRGRKISIPPPLVAIGWLTASLTGCLIVYGMYDQPTVPLEATSVIYAMLSRTAWSVAVSWVIFACVTGHGWVVDSLLSWKAFIPLSRLTYTSYLVSLDVQLYYFFTSKAPLHLDQPLLVYIFLGSVPVIFTVAAVFSLAFESPMIALEKIIFPQASRAAPPKPKPATSGTEAKPEPEVKNNALNDKTPVATVLVNGQANEGFVKSE